MYPSDRLRIEIGIGDFDFKLFPVSTAALCVLYSMYETIRNRESVEEHSLAEVRLCCISYIYAMLLCTTVRYILHMINNVESVLGN
jgi:hypothetical protein